MSLLRPMAPICMVWVFAIAVVASCGATAARAADLYTVGGIAEDVTADNANVARQRAFAKARTDGYALLIARLTLPADATRLSRPSEADLDNLVLSIVVQQEKRSSVRYIATLAVRFKGDQVKALLSAANITVPEWSGKPVTVIPVLQAAAGPQLWEPANDFAKAWAAVDVVVPFAVPKAPAGGDASGLPDAVTAAGGGEPALDLFSQRYGSDNTLVVVATPQIPPNQPVPSPGVQPPTPGLLVTIAARGPAVQGVAGTRNYLPNPGETLPQLLARAANDIAGTVSESFKSGAVSAAPATPLALPLAAQNGTAPGATDTPPLPGTSGGAGTLAVTAPFDGISDWVQLRRKLGATNNVVKGYQVAALARNGASLVLSYAGDQNALQSALMAGGMVLSWQGDHWVLQNVQARPAGGQ